MDHLNSSGSRSEEIVTPASELAEALRTSTTMLEALLVQLRSWGHESAVNADLRIERNEELLRRMGA